MKFNVIVAVPFFPGKKGKEGRKMAVKLFEACRMGNFFAATATEQKSSQSENTFLAF